MRLPILSVVALSLLGACAPEPGAAPLGASAADTGSAGGWVLGTADASAIQAVSPGVFAVGQPGWGLLGRFTASGAALRSVDGGELSLTTAAFGRAGSLVAVPAAEPALGECASSGAIDPSGACLRRVEYGWDGVTGWWEAGTSTLRQGWQLTERPDGEGDLLVVLHAADAEAELLPGADLVSFIDAGGHTWTYRDLRAWDADGASLAARFVVDRDGDVVIHVDDAGATYPVTIDPVLGSAATTLAGPAANTFFGYAATSAGDLNGDGYDDVAVSAYGYGFATGRVYVYMGSSAGLSTTPSLTLSGPSVGAHFGSSLAAGGDVNGDGYADLLIGADAASSNYGQVYVYQGSAAGIGSTASTTLTGSAVGALFGHALDGAGDVNGDGYDDVIVGEQGFDSSRGLAKLYLGSAAGLEMTPAVTLQGVGYGDSFGSSVAGAGDVNGDGRADVLVGAYGVNEFAGEADLYNGGPFGISSTPSHTWSGGLGEYLGFTVSTVGDLNRDGYADVAISAVASSSFTGDVRVYYGSSAGPSVRADATLGGETAPDYFGWSVAHGDVDGDGFTDVFVSAPFHDSSAGRVYLYPGSSRGLVMAASETVDGVGANAFLGTALSTGDVNGDGVTDLLAGAYGVSSYTGAAYVYAGEADADSDGYAASVDCDDLEAGIHPGATELPDDGVDQDCDGAETCFADADDDGYRPNAFAIVASADLSCTGPGEAGASTALGDCDDADPALHPGATEIVADGADQDCDGADLCYVDVDRDGYRTDATVRSGNGSCTDAGEAEATTPTGDCNDNDHDVYPGARETVDDGVDSDCDGGELCYVDADGDGFRPEGFGTVSSADLDCADTGEAGAASADGDCDDADAARNPGARETTGDEIDMNCDGAELCFSDADADGFRPNVTDTYPSADTDCSDVGEAPATEPAGDCADTDSSINPGATEIVGDQIDENCDGDETCFVDNDGDGYRPDDTTTVTSTNLSCVDRGEATADEPVDDCDDTDRTYHPGATEDDCTDPNDYNCDGSVGYVDADGDSFPACGDCDDANNAVSPDADEVCNGIDDDCDGVVDPDTSTDATEWYPDADGDGYTSARGAVSACTAPDGYFALSDPSDCNDKAVNTYPGADDPPQDGRDQDCDGADSDGPKADDPGEYQGICGCASGAPGSASGAGLLGLGLAGLLVRRRRSA